MLGEGGFGKVYKGRVDFEMCGNSKKSGEEIIVAVKKLNSDSWQGYKEWKMEVNFLGYHSYPNLIKLIGYGREDKQLLLIYEYMKKGNLENHLFRSMICRPTNYIYEATFIRRKKS